MNCMAEIGKNLKNLWLRGMQAIGTTASNIASNTKYKVDEMNLINRRREILNDFGAKAYSLWQKGESFPDELDRELCELKELDEKLNDLRAERLTGNTPAQPSEPAQKSEKKPDDSETEKTPDEKPDGHQAASVNVIPPPQQEKTGKPVNDRIDDLFEQSRPAESIAGKVNDALDKMTESIQAFDDGEKEDPDL